MLIDIIFAVCMVIAILKGFQKGLVVAIFSIVAFIIGLAAALKLSTVVAGYLKDSISVSAKWLPFISFVLVFLGVILLVRMGAKMIEKTLQVAMLGWVNRLGGIIFYAVLYLLILSIFLFYAQKLQLLQPSTIQSSLTYSFVQPWGPKVINGIGNFIPFFKDMFADLEAFFTGISNKIGH